MQKRTLITVIIAVIILIAIAFAVNFFFLSGSGEREEGNFIQDFFPFGRSGEEDIPFSDRDGQDNGSRTITDRFNELIGGRGSSPELELFEISPTAISGAVIFINENGDTTIRHIERSTGHIFETDVDTRVTERISNVTIPKIQETKWLPDGNAVVIRYLDENTESVESFYAELTESEGVDEQPLDGTFLSKNIHDLTLSPDGSQLFYISGTQNNTSGVVAGPDGGEPTTIFTSALTEWLSMWVSNNTIALTTKASEDVSGFLYFLNPKTGSERKILGPIAGLTTNTSPDGEYVLFSQNDGGRINLNVYNVSENEFISLAIDTLPEKCVWSPLESTVAYCAVPKLILSGSYPDAWYQGVVGFADRIWEVDVLEQTADFLVDPQIAARQELDVINPMLDPDAETLIFMNKKDSTLWSLRL